MTSSRISHSFVLAGGLALVLLVSLGGCFPDLSGAPCTTSANCPQGQFCGSDGKCTSTPGGSIDSGAVTDSGTGGGSGTDGGGGPKDGGTLDGGSKDGGVADAGPAPFDAGAGEGLTGSCFDGQDNDSDGKTDCADSECVGQACRPPVGECDVAEVCVSGMNTCPSNALAPTTTKCGPAAGCTDGVLQPQAFCNGNGSCSLQTAIQCNGYACSGATSCRNTCSGDNDCANTHFCQNTMCVKKNVNGTACTPATANQCATGFCADNRCCSSECSGACQTCDNTLGMCGSVTAGTDPKLQCGQGLCDMNGQCSSTCTAPPSCMNSSCKPTAVCAGSTCIAKRDVNQGCTQACECLSAVCTPYYPDNDRDGYGAGLPQSFCGAGNRVGFAKNKDDCDDMNEMVNPGVAEVVGNGVDDDCNGVERCFVDADRDSYRSFDMATKNTTNFDCADAGLAFATLPGGDRCDTDKNAHPGVTAFSTSLNGCNNYDWDSDGVEERKYGEYSCVTLGRCTAGYNTAFVVDCNKPGTLLTCPVAGCTGVANANTLQPCR